MFCFYARMMEILFTHSCMVQIETSAFNGFNAEFIPNVFTTLHCAMHASCVRVPMCQISSPKSCCESSPLNVVQSWSASTTYNKNILIKLSFQFASNTDYFECISFWVLLVKFPKKVKPVMTTA